MQNVALRVLQHLLKYKDIMTRRILTLILLITSIYTFAQQAKTPSFPGAEGFGRYTTGGRGGTVYRVTSLEDDPNNIKEGTFRHACQQKGTRTIVFGVSGTIHLKGELKLNNDNVTIAGQTAPGDGICIAGYPFVLSANNVIIRFMRFRPGNENVAFHEGDGLGGMDRKNIIIDHCSVSWSIDECLSVYGCTDMTVQWCIGAQSLVSSGHAKGTHGYGGNWGGSGASYHHNLLAHHDSRVPRLGPRTGTQTDERVDLRNNVFYNWAGNGCYGGEGMNVNIVNNYYKPGPATRTRSANIQRRIASIGIRTSQYTGHDTEKPNDWDKMWHVWGKFFIDGNVNPSYADVTNDNWTYGVYNQINNADNDNTYTDVTKDTMRLSGPLAFAGVTTHSAETAFEKVLSYAGASLRRDALDKMIVDDTRNGVATCTGGSYTDKNGNTKESLPGLINSQEDVVYADGTKGYPVLNGGAAPTDTDGDGMPDSWETANGLNPNDGTDGAVMTDNGYTNLEVYMNSLVENIMNACTADGRYEDTSEPEPVVAEMYEISHATHIGDTGWNFNDGFSINTEKGYASASSLYVKYSNGVTYTINIPGNMSIGKVRIIGYGNDANTDTYLSALGTKTYGNTDYVFPKGKSEANNRDYTITLDTPASKTLPLVFKGGQACMRIILYPVKNTVTQTGGEYTISVATYKGSSATATWDFADNISVSNTNNKGYGAGNNNCIKYSAGTLFTINLPEGMNVSRIKINGYDNYNDGDSYLAELNGEKFSSTDYVFPRKDANSGKEVVKEYTIDLASPASNTLTFKAGGKQVVWTITLYTLSEITISEHSLAPDVPAGPANVTLVRTLSDAYWNSFCVPFDISADKIDKVLGGAKVLQFSSVNGSTMVFDETTEGIKAGVPYLIKPLSKVENPRFDNVTIVSGAPKSVTIDGCSYIGTYTKYAMEYGGTELMFNTRNGLSRPKQAPDNVMRGLRAYLRLPSVYAANAKVMIPGGTTGIEEISYDAFKTVRKGVYNLNGQYVGTSAEGLPEGIYIVDGKKMVISNK